MLKNKKLLIAVGIIIAAIIAITLIPKQQDYYNGKPIVRIGVTLPLTGDMAWLGQSIRATLEMALADLPDDTRNHYQIIFSDDRYELRQMASNQNRHISVHRVNAIMSLFDGGAVSALIADRHNIPHITCSWGSEMASRHPFTINHWSRSETQARAFTQMLSDDNINSIAIVSNIMASNEELIYHIAQMSADRNITITSANMVNFGMHDFRMIIEQVRGQNPDAIMFILLDPQKSIFARQMHEQRLTLPIVAVDNLHTAQHKEWLHGARFVYSLNGGETFIQKLAKHDISWVPCSANLYDAFMMLVHVFENYGNELSGADVKTHLYNISDFRSILGTTISIDSDGMTDVPMRRARIENGQVIW